MAGDWAETTLGEVLTLQRGFDLPETERKPGRYPVLASTGPVGTHVEAMVKGPGVLIGRSGSLGGGQFIEGDFWPLNTTLWVKDFKGNDRRFCYYLLKSLDFAKFNAGSGVPTLNRNHIHPISLSIPHDRIEQRAIAQILGTLEDRIDLNRRKNETLEAIAQALFKSWFVDFDPVRAKSEGRDPGLPSSIDALFPNALRDSGIGPVPRGWSVAAISDLARVNARTLSRADRLEVIQYIEISEVNRGEVANVRRYERGFEPSRARRRLSHGDTVLSTVRPDRGAYFLCLNPPANLIASTGFAVFTPRDSNWAFLHTALTRSEVGEELGRLADGGAYPAIRPEVIAGLRLAAPPVEVRAAFEGIARPLFEQAEQNRSANRSLTNLLVALLPKLVSGEIRIQAPDRIAGDVT